MFPPKNKSKGLDMPSPIGGKPPTGPPPPEAEPDADDTGGGVKPEALMYHAEEHECQMCSHMDESGNCDILKMQVSPVGGCNAFEAGKQSEEESGEAPGQQPMFGGQ